MKGFRSRQYYRNNAQEINRANLRSLRIFALINIPISALDMAAQITQGGVNLLPTTAMLAYSLILSVLVRDLVRDDCAHATPLLYLAQLPPMLGAILNGTIADPGHAANSYLIYVTLLPSMILDYPLRVFFYQGTGSLLLVILSFLFKPDRSIARWDLLNVTRALILVAALDLVVIRARMSELERARQAEIEAAKDPLTGLQSRPFFQRRALRHLREEAALICFDVTSYELCCDMFGHDFGDRLLQVCARTLRRHFPGADVCRWSQNRFVVLLTGKSTEEETMLRRIHRCQEDFAEVRIGGITLRPELCIGYVTDLLQSEEHLGDLIRLADVRTCQAASARGRIMGGGFDSSLLQDQAIRSVMLRYQGDATRDELTGLLRMTPFVSLCEQLLGQQLMREEACILYFNLIGMKHYNEEYGFSAGDRLIGEITRMIREHFPDSPATRTAGDHFLVLTRANAAQDGRQKLTDDFTTLYGDRHVGLGIGQYNLQQGDHIALACDRAKIAADSVRGQKQTFCLYDEKLDESLRLNRFLTGNLTRAIRSREIVAYYQPIYDAQTGQMCACEALARWIDPKRGLISPAVFIPVLENARLITQLDLAILDEALRALQHRRARGEKLLPVSVNLSRYDLDDLSIVEEIRRRVDEAGIDHRLLSIEITESAFVGEFERINAIIHAFQKEGFSVWMDDFGSGYSSLNMLQETSFDLIKLDMLFMRGKNPGRAMVMVREIIHMAHSLHMSTLVEGVETQDQVQFLKEAGAGRIQGFYYSHPIPERELEEFLRNQEPAQGQTEKTPQG